MKNCLFVWLVRNKMKKSGEWKGHFWKWVFKSSFLLVMAARTVAIGYEWKWPWNADSHCVLENDDLLIYSPSFLFPVLSFLHAPIVINNIIIISLFFEPSSSFHFTFFKLNFLLCFFLLTLLVVFNFFHFFLFWPFWYQWHPNSPNYCEGILCILLDPSCGFFVLFKNKCMQISFYG